MDGFRFWALALLLMAALPVSRVDAAKLSSDASATPRLEAGGATVLVAPVLWVLGALGVPVQAPAPLPNSLALTREQGEQRLEFPVHDAGLGVYLEVRGRVQFEQAQIRLADGSLRTIPLGHAARGGGLYELSRFDGPTGVDAVVLSARARSSEAQVGVRLGR
jgi:hypothetical protein